MTRLPAFFITFISVLFILPSLHAQVSDQSVDSIYRQGLTFMEEYDFQEAAKCFYNCQRERNDVSLYHYMLGQAYEKMGNIQDARLFYRKASSLDSLEVKYLLALGNIEIQRRDYAAARDYYQSAVLLDTTNAYYYKLLGKSCYYAKDLLCAIGAFNYSLYYNNRDLETISLMAHIYYNNQQYDLALEWIVKGLRLDAQSPDLRQLKLRSEVKSDAFDEALTTAQQILQDGDSSYLVLKYYGIALNKTEDYEHSAEVLASLLEINEDEGLHYYLADSYAELGRTTESIEHLETAAYQYGIGPMVWRYFHMMSRGYSEMGNTKLALRFMERAYDLNPDPLLLYQLARLTDTYYLDKQMAVNRYNQYLATDDTLFRDQVTDRIMELKRHLHQSNVK